MHPFDFVQVRDVAGAVKSGAKASTKFVAGGTNLVDLMKCNVEQPSHLVDINGIALSGIEETTGGVRIGALTRMADVALHPTIVRDYPVVSQALMNSASPQIRNAASIGGNLMQRTRCPYFRELTWTPCNKRDPGSGCSALEGENRLHAILGTSESCIATHPSDLAVSLAALDAVITIRGARGERNVAATDFHLVPGNTPHLEHDLRAGELITSVFIPRAEHAKRSAYLKIRDRSAYEFALTSAAVGADVNGGVVRSVRIALGGVGTKPWRARRAEAVLTGSRAERESYRRAAEAELSDAVSHGQNAFKIELAKRTLVRALDALIGGAA